MDKTGTITKGEPEVTDIVSLNGSKEDDILSMAASAEKNSEHPLAAAIYQKAIDKKIAIEEPEKFEAVPGMGISAVIV